MTQRINLLFVSSYIDLGGGETALLNLVDHLDPARYHPHLLVRAEGQLAAAWRQRGWPVDVIPWRGATTYFIPALWSHLPISRHIQSLIRQRDIHLVHSDYHTLPMALPAAERAAVPALWWCWGWWFHPKPWQRAFFRRPAATIALEAAAIALLHEVADGAKRAGVFASVRISPNGRWIVVERRAAWSSAATYRFGLMTTHLLSGLEIHDTTSGAPPQVISDPGHATGYVSGPFSPDGERMLVFRLTETSWRLGVLTLATGETRWFALTPEYTGLGRTVAWRSATEVVVIARAPDDLPLVFRLGGQTQVREWSFETFAWAAGLAAVTERIGLFMTVHVPLVHPVYAAKALATVDHISGGRAGLNIVCGWNPEEFAMFGAALTDLLTFLGGDLGSLKSRYTFSATKQKDGSIDVVAVVTHAELKKTLKQLRMVTNPEKWGVARVVIDEPKGDSSTIVFEPNQRDAKVPAADMAPPA